MSDAENNKTFHLSTEASYNDDLLFRTGKRYVTNLSTVSGIVIDEIYLLFLECFERFIIPTVPTLA